MKKIIAIANRKGGVGKTTTAINVAVRLSNLGYKTLLIDLDSQGSLTASLGYDARNVKNTMAELLEAIIYKNEVEKIIEPISINEKLFMLAADDRLEETRERIISATRREDILKKLIKKIVVIEDYDYILIDCPPSVDTLTLNAFVVADSVLIPVVPQFLDYKGFLSLYNNIAEIRDEINEKLIIEGIVITKCNEKLKLTKKVTGALEEIEKMLPDVKILNTKISQCTKAAEAPLKGCDIFSFAPNSKTAKEYIMLVDEILQNEKEV